MQYIPKPDGRMRPLGIPTVKDRIVQTALLLLLEPIFEADFLDSSFGFRPGRSAHQAVDRIQQHLAGGFKEVYDADLQAYFDTIPHEQLLKCLKMRIADRSVLSLIGMWLQAPVVERDDQGQKKTRVVQVHQPRESVDFLGFTFRYDLDQYGRSHRYWNVFPSKKARQRVRDKLRELICSERAFLPIPLLIAEVNQALRGWKTYFSHGDPRVAFREVNQFLIDRLTAHLQRRSQRPFRPPEGMTFSTQLLRLGLELL